MTNIFDITAFGAIGDGVFDCTQAIQAALDAAGEVRGAVVVPPGNYLTGYVRAHPFTCVTGFPAWSFRDNGASNLILKDANQPCLLDITGAFGCTVRGICLDGRKLGDEIHGIMLANDCMGFFRGEGEDTPTMAAIRRSAARIFGWSAA